MGFGWCVHDSAAVGPARVVARDHFATSAKEIFVARYMGIREQIRDLLRHYSQVEAVGLESPAYGEQWSPGMYALFVYVNEVVYSERRDVVYFDPGTVKMLAKIDPKTRKGKMHKSDMVLAAKTDTSTTCRWNHNEADAYHVARFTARFWLFLRGDITEDQLTPAEYHAFARTHTFTKGERAGETVKFGAAFKEGKRFYRFSQLETP